MKLKDLVEYGLEEGVATLTLNRPEKLNAIDGRVVDRLLELIDKVEKSSEAKVLVIRGAGRAFCAGADLADDANELGTQDVQKWRAVLNRAISMYRRLAEFPKPTIAAVQGYAIGMGFFLANACDMIISTKDCRFGTAEIRQGQSATDWIPAWNVPRNMMMEMLLTGDFIDGQRAEKIGMVNRAVSEEALEKEVCRLARKLALIDPITMSMNKANINMWYNMVQYFRAGLFSIESGAILNVSEERRRWAAAFGKQTMKEFLKFRDEPFKNIDRD